MMCLLNTLKPPQGGSSDYSTYSNIDSPESTQSSEASSDSNSDKSPPQLSPQNGKVDPLFVQLPTHNNTEAKNPLCSPEMALLTPQISPEEDSKENNDIVLDNENIVQEDKEILPIVRKTVPFTFCNMRQNIFDLKKKRGRKKSTFQESVTSKSSAKNFIQNITNTSTPNTNVANATTAMFEKPCPLRKRKVPRSESLDVELLSSKRAKIINEVQHRRNSEIPPSKKHDYEDEIIFSDTEENLHLELESNSENEEEMEDLIDSKELVESVVDNLLSSVVNSSNIENLEPNQDHLDQDLSIPVMDIFVKTPLNNFECSNCAKSYNFQDSISFNLKCQTMLITCCQCSQWTLRRIDLEDKMIF